jgi:hypothetical protein
MFGFLFPIEVAMRWGITDDRYFVGKNFTDELSALHQRNKSVNKTV